MRCITIWLMSTLSALVLLFSYPTSTNARITVASQALDQSTDTPTDTSTGTGSATGSTTSEQTPSHTTTDPTTTDTGVAASAHTYAGDAVMTRWGVVQVQITVADGKITKSEVLQIPWENHEDQQINAYAVPVLNQEAVAAQSAQIDMVSGATVTSGGYIRSLQSAIDQVHLS